MILTDTHAHLYAEQFDGDADAMMKRALERGVQRFFLPAIDSSTTERMLEFESKYSSFCHAMIGIHPTSVKADNAYELEHVANWLERREFVAIGEIGIDLYWDKSFLQEQQDVFKIQVEWAKERGLPVAIHVRDSFDETFEVLEDLKGPELKGVFHCFSGTLEQAQKALEYNMMLGIGGVVTFKNGKIDKFLDQIPLKHIVLETDSPYLAPTPYRGKRNESAYLWEVAAKMATIHQCGLDEIAEITTKNSIELFGV